MAALAFFYSNYLLLHWQLLILVVMGFLGSVTFFMAEWLAESNRQESDYDSIWRVSAEDEEGTAGQITRSWWRTYPSLPLWYVLLFTDLICTKPDSGYRNQTLISTFICTKPKRGDVPQLGLFTASFLLYHNLKELRKDVTEAWWVDIL